MTDIDALLHQASPTYWQRRVAEQFRMLRLQRNITQQELSERSGISLSTLKRFEQQHEIAFSKLIQLAVILDATEAFASLFQVPEAKSIEEYVRQHEKKTRKRARK